jgi:hypothetical protein
VAKRKKTLQDRKKPSRKTPIMDTLSKDVLIYTLSHLSPKDLFNMALASKYHAGLCRSDALFMHRYKRQYTHLIRVVTEQEYRKKYATPLNYKNTPLSPADEQKTSWLLQQEELSEEQVHHFRGQASKQLYIVLEALRRGMVLRIQYATNPEITATIEHYGNVTENEPLYYPFVAEYYQTTYSFLDATKDDYCMIEPWKYGGLLFRSYDYEDHILPVSHRDVNKAAKDPLALGRKLLDLTPQELEKVRSAPIETPGPHYGQHAIFHDGLCQWNEAAQEYALVWPMSANRLLFHECYDQVFQELHCKYDAVTKGFFQQKLKLEFKAEIPDSFSEASQLISHLVTVLKAAELDIINSSVRTVESFLSIEYSGDARCTGEELISQIMAIPPATMGFVSLKVLLHSPPQQQQQTLAKQGKVEMQVEQIIESAPDIDNFYNRLCDTVFPDAGLRITSRQTASTGCITIGFLCSRQPVLSYLDDQCIFVELVTHRSYQFPSAKCRNPAISKNDHNLYGNRYCANHTAGSMRDYLRHLEWQQRMRVLEVTGYPKRANLALSDSYMVQIQDTSTTIKCTKTAINILKIR